MAGRGWSWGEASSRMKGTATNITAANPATKRRNNAEEKQKTE